VALGHGLYGDLTGVETESRRVLVRIHHRLHGASVFDIAGAVPLLPLASSHPIPGGNIN
jgi:hypothetical protein